jgi:hypothetical protein
MADIDDTRIPFASHPLPRRRLLGQAGLSVLAGAIGAGGSAASAEPAEPDPHAAWWGEHLTLLETLDGPDLRHVDLDDSVPEWVRCLELEGLMAQTPASGMDGAIVQLRLLVDYDWIGEDECSAATANALATLRRLKTASATLASPCAVASQLGADPAAELGDEFFRLIRHRARFEGTQADGDVRMAIAEELYQAVTTIGTTHARSAAGLLAKLRVLRELVKDGPTVHDRAEDLVDSLVADVRRLHARGEALS